MGPSELRHSSVGILSMSVVKLEQRVLKSFTNIPPKISIK